VSTGLKIATHEHLALIDRNILAPLCDTADNVLSSYFSVNQDHFLDSMSEWSSKLKELELQHNDSTELKFILEKCSAIMLAKPNGALGADTITVFYKVEDKQRVREYYKNHNIKYITGLDHLSRGAHYVD
jgi:hypothetical protein